MNYHLLSRCIASTCSTALLGCALAVPSAFAGNPLLPHVYAADPSAHVWPGDSRLWLYTSHDTPNTNTHSTMASYHVFSTENLVDWTDHGQVLHLDQVPWAISHMWAIDAAYWKGQYYLVYCAMERESSTFKTGLAVSDRPEGPFRDIGFIRGVDWGQDPALFIDEDHTPYLLWGSGHKAHGVQLSDDLLRAIPGTYVNLTDQLPWVFEGPWVHKHEGKYYLSYPGLPDNEWPEHMYWATADKPLGPYTFGGKYMASHHHFAGTNHGSIIQYKGKWLFFYHSAWLSGGMSEVRNLMADYLEYETDGSIRMITPTTEGVAVETAPAPSRVTILLEAETADLQGGRIDGPRVVREKGGYSGRGYVAGFLRIHEHVEVMAQVARDSQWKLVIRYACPRDEEYSVRVGPNEKKVVFPASKTFRDLEIGIVDLKSGDNFIRLIRSNREHSGIELDCFKLISL